MRRFAFVSIAVVLLWSAAAEADFKPTARRSSDSEPLMSHVEAGNEMNRLRNVALQLYNPKVQLELGIGPRKQRAVRDVALKVSKDFLDA
jgi:hypothetical protein